MSYNNPNNYTPKNLQCSNQFNLIIELIESYAFLVLSPSPLPISLLFVDCNYLLGLVKIIKRKKLPKLQ